MEKSIFPCGPFKWTACENEHIFTCGHIKRAARKNTYSLFSLLPPLKFSLFLSSPLPSISFSPRCAEDFSWVPPLSLTPLPPLSLSHTHLSSPHDSTEGVGVGARQKRRGAASSTRRRWRRGIRLPSPPIPSLPRSDGGDGRQWQCGRREAGGVEAAADDKEEEEEAAAPPIPGFLFFVILFFSDFYFTVRATKAPTHENPIFTCTWKWRFSQIPGCVRAAHPHAKIDLAGTQKPFPVQEENINGITGPHCIRSIDACMQPVWIISGTSCLLSFAYMRHSPINGCATRAEIQAAFNLLESNGTEPIEY